MGRLGLIILTLLTIQCSSPKEKAQYPFELVNSKTEGSDKMDIYVPVGEMNIEMLKSLCKDQKDNWTDGTFYFLVVFDKKENVTFPNNPFTALYGVDEEPQKHIKALFQYNRLNAYSRLTLYSKNMWESSPKTIGIK